MKLPVIILNFKAYDEVMGAKGLELARLCEKFAKVTKKSIVIAPLNCEIAHVARSVSIPVFAQHVDHVNAGSYTGHIPPEAIKAAGGAGTLINHSEYKLAHGDINDIIGKCRSLGLTSVVCADDIEETRSLAVLNPDFLAIEPPELIGGDVSVTSARPEVISNSVKLVKETSPRTGVLCGAGVKTGADVKKALELGSVGVLLASGVVKAKDRRKALEELADGLP